MTSVDEDLEFGSCLESSPEGEEYEYDFGREPRHPRPPKGTQHQWSPEVVTPTFLRDPPLWSKAIIDDVDDLVRSYRPFLRKLVIL
jgi:hypothetical protein